MSSGSCFAFSREACVLCVGLVLFGFFLCVCIPFLYVWVFVRVCAFASCAYTLCYVVVCIVVHFVCARSYSSPPLLDIKMSFLRRAAAIVRKRAFSPPHSTA